MLYLFFMKTLRFLTYSKKIKTLYFGILTCAFLVSNTLKAQNSELAQTVVQLKTKVEKTQGSEKLKWMDSLSRVMHSTKAKEYEVFAKQTIQHALKQDSIRLALIHSSKLLDHLSVSLGQIEYAQKMFHELIPKFPKNDHYSALGNFYSEGASTYLMSGHFEESLVYLEQVQEFALKAKDTVLLVNNKEDFGHVFSMMGDFQKASDVILEAIQLYSTLNPKGAGYIKRGLAILYSQNGLQTEAKKIREEVVDFAKGIKNNSLVYTAFYDQAFDEMLHGNPHERLRYLDSATVYNKHLTDEYYLLELSIAKLGAYSENGFIQKAKQVKQQLEERLKDTKTPNLPEYNLAMGQYEYAVGNYAEAAIWGERENEALKGSNFYEGIYLVNEFLSKVYNRLGNQKRAYQYLKVSSNIKDSIESVQKANGFSYYLTLLETEKKEAKIVVQESEIQLLNAQNKTKSQLILFGGMSLVAISIITFLVYSWQFNRKKRKLQTEFSQNLIKEREDQYSHISRELHDSVGQKLMLLVKKVQKTKEEGLNALAKESLHEIRTISHGLHPATLRQAGISTAITSMVHQLDTNTDIFFTLNIDNIDGILNPEQELHLYRIIQESLNNIVKHSGAKASSIKVEKKANTIYAIVSDNGKGFDFSEKIKKGTLGMKTLLERAKIIGSKLNVSSMNQKGTKIELTVPLNH